MKTADEIFSANSLPAREQVAKENWYKIKETIGNAIHGTFMGWWLSASTGAGFKDQIGIAIKKDDGTVWGVSVGDTKYMRSRLETSIVGDAVGFRYEGDKDTGKPQPAKIVKFYNPDAEARRIKGDVKITKPETSTAATEPKEPGLEIFDEPAEPQDDPGF
jgi:hypothetical protein